MCGIVGYIGGQDAVPILMEGLSRLEYRGYDSAGIAIVTPRGSQVFRRVGRVRELEVERDEVFGCLERANHRVVAGEEGQGERQKERP